MRTLRSAVLALAGAAGAVALAWIAASVALGWGLVIVVTGSMVPVVPPGSASVTVPVPASSIVVGDIVTIPRGEGRPSVTHRVVSVTGGPSDNARELVLRGDANSVDDPSPYVVTQVHKVVATVPGVGHVLWWLRSPAATGVATLVVAALMVWAFWPERRHAMHRTTSRTPSIPADVG